MWLTSIAHGCDSAATASPSYRGKSEMKPHGRMLSWKKCTVRKIRTGDALGIGFTTVAADRSLRPRQGCWRYERARHPGSMT